MKYQVVKDLDEHILYRGEERIPERCIADGEIKEISVLFIEPEGQVMKFEEYLYDRDKQGRFQRTAMTQVVVPSNDEFFDFLQRIRKKHSR